MPVIQIKNHLNYYAKKGGDIQDKQSKLIDSRSIV
jgi:hypothetical protein